MSVSTFCLFHYAFVIIIIIINIIIAIIIIFIVIIIIFIVIIISIIIINTLLTLYPIKLGSAYINHKLKEYLHR